MANRVYIETTIPSYLAALPSRDLLQAARQRITHEWWIANAGIMREMGQVVARAGYQLPILCTPEELLGE